MVVTPKLYPRATVKRIVKAHSKRNISKNADILVRLNYNTYVLLQICRWMPLANVVVDIDLPDIPGLYAIHARVGIDPRPHFPSRQVFRIITVAQGNDFYLTD